MSGYDSLERRLDRMETMVRPDCSTCGGWPVRIAFEYDDHTEENMPPLGCPGCARQPVENVVIDLRGDDDDDGLGGRITR